MKKGDCFAIGECGLFIVEKASRSWFYGTMIDLVDEGVWKMGVSVEYLKSETRKISHKEARKLAKPIFAEINKALASLEGYRNG